MSIGLPVRAGSWRWFVFFMCVVMCVCAQCACVHVYVHNNTPSPIPSPLVLSSCHPLIPSSPHPVALFKRYDDPLHARMARARFPNRDVASSGTQEHSLLNQGSSIWQKPPGWSKPGFNLSTTITLDKPEGDEAAGKCGDQFTYVFDGIEGEKRGTETE